MNPTARFALALVLGAGLGAGLLLAQAPGRKKRSVTDAEVMRVHRSAILIDTHNDIPTFTVDGALANMGGVIQININCGFISQKSADAAQAAQSSGTPSTVAPVRQVEKVAV